MLVIKAVNMAFFEIIDLVFNGGIMRNKLGMMGSQACENELLLQAQLLR